LQPSGLNSRFTAEHLSFTDYIDATKKMLHHVNSDYQLNQTDQIIELNCPFEWRPTGAIKKGALLIHGLFDTPFMMRDIAAHLVSQGYLVRSILLPGHGTIPADLFGFSTGAILSLNYVLQHPHSTPSIKTITMLSPVFAISTAKSIFMRVYRMFRWMFKEQKWIFRHESPDYTKYTSFPVNSAYLVQRLITETNILLATTVCTVPIFIAMSEDDDTVRPEVALSFFKHTSNLKNIFLYYTNKTKKYPDSRIHTVPSAKPDENILDFSHVSLSIAPDNMHYGRNGDHQEPIHEPKDSDKTQALYLGALTPKNVTHYRLRRLTYNPYFSSLMEQVDQFLASVHKR
jgi:esterase/lipase